MNKIVNKFFLDGDKFIPEMHLTLPEFSYRACGPLTKNKKRSVHLWQAGKTDLIY